jgi:hypothetical protein
MCAVRDLGVAPPLKKPIVDSCHSEHAMQVNNNKVKDGVYATESTVRCQGANGYLLSGG